MAQRSADLEDALPGHLQELRRGTVVLACLAALRQPGYGYALLGDLEAAGIDVDANTLYPLLRRLERQGLLTSTWNTDEPRPRKFYATSDAGRELLTRLHAEWTALDAALRSLVEHASASTTPSSSTHPPRTDA